jgi:DnaJ-class molecular chaperone
MSRTTGRLEGGGGPGSLYGVLGVAPGSSQEAIAHAYRQQARGSHPDARPDDPGAAARFRLLTSAYEVLGDPVRRASYDRARRSGTAGESRGGYTNSRDMFFGARPPRPSGSLLWAGPVRVEGLPEETFAGSRGSQTSRRGELDELTSVLLGFLIEGWPR